MRPEELTRRTIDEWIGAKGPARRALLEPLRERLVARPRTPRTLARTLAPLRWMLEHAAAEGLPVGADRALRPDFALWVTAELGFPVDRGCPYFEAEALVHMLDASGALLIDDGRARLRERGRELLDADNPWLWFWCSFSTGYNRAPGLFGAAWEYLLAWWLQPEVTTTALDRAVAEAGGCREAHDVCRDDIFVPASDAASALWALGRALGFFATERPRGADKPRLSGMGRSTALAILQGSVYGDAARRYSAMGPPPG